MRRRISGAVIDALGFSLFSSIVDASCLSEPFLLSLLARSLRVTLFFLGVYPFPPFSSSLPLLISPFTHLSLVLLIQCISDLIFWVYQSLRLSLPLSLSSLSLHHLFGLIFCSPPSCCQSLSPSFFPLLLFLTIYFPAHYKYTLEITILCMFMCFADFIFMFFPSSHLVVVVSYENGRVHFLHGTSSLTQT